MSPRRRRSGRFGSTDRPPEGYTETPFTRRTVALPRNRGVAPLAILQGQSEVITKHFRGRRVPGRVVDPLQRLLQ